jgi:hypothetical protein
MDSNERARRIKLRLSGEQHAKLERHLFPGDGLEAVALALCGRSADGAQELVSVHHIEVIPHDECPIRDAARVTWNTRRVPALLARAAKEGLALLKIHSHPGDWPVFSSWDDAADRDLFPGVFAWTDTNRPHLSAIMLPGGRIIARAVTPEGRFAGVDSVSVVGPRLRSWFSATASDVKPVPEWPTGGDDYHRRTEQAFGEGTTRWLSRLSVGVVGCSGTGGWVVEMLARLGVRELVLVDPDHVEPVNLNRIVHATVRDADARTPKVDVARRAVEGIGFNTIVEVHCVDVRSPAILRRLAQCDVVFGCVDSIEARDVLNRLAVYYLLPYIDVGVRLEADGEGGVQHIVGGVQYVHPDSSTLIERGLYTAKELADAGLRRTDPAAFEDQVGRGYIRGATDGRPAVASVNAFFASLAVNELLERIHGYRHESPVGVMVSLSQLRFVTVDDSGPSPALSRRAGRGDVEPLLGLPFLSNAH